MTTAAIVCAAYYPKVYTRLQRGHRGIRRAAHEPGRGLWGASGRMIRESVRRGASVTDSEPFLTSPARVVSGMVMEDLRQGASEPCSRSDMSRRAVPEGGRQSTHKHNHTPPTRTAPTPSKTKLNTVDVSTWCSCEVSRCREKMVQHQLPAVKTCFQDKGDPALRTR